MNSETNDYQLADIRSNLNVREDKILKSKEHSGREEQGGNLKDYS